MSKTKILNLALILSSLFVYLEWGGDKNMFLVEGEIELFSKFFKDPLSVMHPLTLLPIIGQILLIITLFQKAPGKLLTYSGFGGLAILVLFILLAGIMSMNFKTIISTLPFLLTGILIIKNRRKILKDNS